MRHSAISFARFVHRENDDQGRVMRYHAVDGELDWGRVVAVQRWPHEDAVMVTLDSGLELRVEGYFDEVVDRWKRATSAGGAQ